MNKLSIVRNGATAGASAAHIADVQDARVTWAVSEREGASQEPFDGVHAARQDQIRSRRSYGA
jgi:hypothetical protein